MIAALLLAAAPAFAGPPMGWSTWNAFGCGIDEALVRRSADYLVSTGLRDAGYTLVSVDDCWQAKERDAAGRLRADPAAFPSGMKALGDLIHEHGMLFGIYTSAGRVTCEERAGSLGHEAQDAATFAAWGADFVKDDFCGGPPGTLLKWWPWWDGRSRYEALGRALASSGRPITLSICSWGYGRPWEWGPAARASLWRTGRDITPDWDGVMRSLDSVVGKEAFAGPGRYNDPDMLVVGLGTLTPDENLSHFAMWAMVSAPLIAGHDPARISSSTLAILKAPELIALDQDPLGAQGRPVVSRGRTQVWLKPLAGGSHAVALLNRGPATARIEARWTELGLPPGPRRARDLWLRRDLGEFPEAFAADVPSHGVVLVKLAPKK